MKVTVLQNIMSANDQIAVRNTELLNKHKVIGINITSSPGAGKTTLLMETIKRFKDKARIAVIEGDVASTIDADKINKEGIIALQINTGGQCHIDAMMVANALEQLPLDDIDLLFVENVGNLICTADFKIGTQKGVMLLSVPEGDDKPYKYPLMFTTVDAVIVSKMDYLPLSDFNLDTFKKTITGMNPKAAQLQISARTGEGMDDWIKWLESVLKGE
ncbi:MAG: hydrogenase nickel incorporation protein HypB [Dehalococcoidales bacterium]|nr:hydrogenase nickel incorporation protein HypB [Dehalococcoidales bacterium]